jgi:hypothetical protein
MNMRFNQKWIAAALIFVVVVWMVMRKEKYAISSEMNTQLSNTFTQYGVNNQSEKSLIRQFIQASKPGMPPPSRFSPQIDDIFKKYKPGLREAVMSPFETGIPMSQGKRQGMRFPNYKGFECKMTPPNKFGCQAL